MISLLLAIQFLTIVPLKIKQVSDKSLSAAAEYFPFVGLFIGLALTGVNALSAALNFPSFVTSIILVVSLIVITGGMHLDGLSDTADAFLSQKPREEMLSVMRDPHIGVMGVLSLVSVILLKIGLLTYLSASAKVTALLLFCLLSRWSCVLAMFLFPYARKEGKAKVFIEGINWKIFLLSLFSVSLFSFLLWQVKGILALLIAGCFTYLFGKLAVRKIGGITGDTLGANIELAEVIILFTVCIA